jgi:hypothetical protein
MSSTKKTDSKITSILWARGSEGFAYRIQLRSSTNLSLHYQQMHNFHIHTVHLDTIKVYLFTNWCTIELS